MPKYSLSVSFNTGQHTTTEWPIGRSKHYRCKAVTINVLFIHFSLVLYLVQPSFTSTVLQDFFYWWGKSSFNCRQSVCVTLCDLLIQFADRIQQPDLIWYFCSLVCFQKSFKQFLLDEHLVLMDSVLSSIGHQGSDLTLIWCVLSIK